MPIAWESSSCRTVHTIGSIFHGLEELAEEGELKAVIGVADGRRAGEEVFMGLRCCTAGASSTMLGSAFVVGPGTNREPSILEFDEAALGGRAFAFEGRVAGRKVDEFPCRRRPRRIDLGLPS